ncbi:CLUMA_CG007721, isoform A [Clunio marinus]|uniref:CLUMA_CG007721, isoform A n=1 Tax=Clunio marinus TaxID=568069 RepID=A0A1J1I1P2_9DIPT|nr:CLUMA_CG007721, isoform A [Clunio marinus]
MKLLTSHEAKDANARSATMNFISEIDSIVKVDLKHFNLQSKAELKTSKKAHFSDLDSNQSKPIAFDLLLNNFMPKILLSFFIFYPNQSTNQR